MIYGFPYDTKLDGPPTSADLTTVAAVKGALGPKVIVTPEDEAWIATQIPIASGIITGYLKRELAQAKVIDRYRLGDRRQIEGLYVTRWPIGADVVVREAGKVLQTVDFEAASREGAGWVRRVDSTGASLCWQQLCLIEVEQTGGYKAPEEVPAVIAGACTDIVKAMYFGRGRDPSLRSLDMPDTGAISYGAPGGGAAAAGSSEGGPWAAFLAGLEPYRNWAPP